MKKVNSSSRELTTRSLWAEARSVLRAPPIQKSFKTVGYVGSSRRSKTPKFYVIMDKFSDKGPSTAPTLTINHDTWSYPKRVAVPVFSWNKKTLYWESVCDAHQNTIFSATALVMLRGSEGHREFRTFSKRSRSCKGKTSSQVIIRQPMASNCHQSGIIAKC